MADGDGEDCVNRKNARINQHSTTSDTIWMNIIAVRRKDSFESGICDRFRVGRADGNAFGAS